MVSLKEMTSKTSGQPHARDGEKGKRNEGKEEKRKEERPTLSLHLLPPPKVYPRSAESKGRKEKKKKRKKGGRAYCNGTHPSDYLHQRYSLRNHRENPGADTGRSQSEERGGENPYIGLTR